MALGATTQMSTDVCKVTLGPHLATYKEIFEIGRASGRERVYVLV